MTQVHRGPAPTNGDTNDDNGHHVLDEAKLKAFVGQAVVDMGAAISGLLLHLGDRLGLYKAMAGAGPINSATLAQRTGTAERYVREWLANQAAGGYVVYDPTDSTYELPLEHAMVVANEDSPVFLAGAFETIASCYAAHLTTEWLPALDGVVDKLRAGANVADVGCGYGASTIIMAQAFEHSTFAGFDIHQPSSSPPAQPQPRPACTHG